MSKNKKIILIIIAVAVSILILGGGSAAFFGWRAEKEATVNVTIASGEGNCSLKRDNNILIAPSSTRNGGRIIKLKAQQSLGTKASITWNMNIKEIAGLQDASFKYEMINTSTGVSYGSGNFENAAAGSTITFSNMEEALGFNLEYEFTLYLWIDGTFGGYQTSMANYTLDFDINCDMIGTETGTVNIPTITTGTTAAEYITDLYHESKPTLITQSNSNDEYYYASSVNLMNDGLGDSEGNIRYYGKNPDNYIYFNCINYNNPTKETCELWRIIGVFDNQLKITRAEPIGNHAWDYTKTGSDNAEWSAATLQKLLNNEYFYNEDDVSYYKSNKELYKINFATDGTGIKNDTTRRLIADSTWYLGAWDEGNIYPRTVSNYEHGYERCTTCTGESTWNGKISVPYASDYGFASDLSICDQDMNNYDNENCKGTNWMFKDDYLWLLTIHNEFPNYVWAVQPEGYIRTGNRALGTRPVQPTLYLNDTVEFDGTGNGSENNPYRIITEKPTLVQFITNLYDNTSKTTITNNKIKYNYAEGASLMNDRLGSSGISANAGNIRYYGNNPNNYIDLGDVYETSTVDNFEKYASIFGTFGVDSKLACRLAVNCSLTILNEKFGGEEQCNAFLESNFGTTDNSKICGEVSVVPGTPKALYRIIGVYKDVELADGTKKDLVKVVRDTPTVNASWDQSGETENSGSGINEWSQADLLKLLNSGYESESVGGSLYWNNVDGGRCYSYNYITQNYEPIKCNFGISGLADAVKDKIVEVKWNTGGWSSNDVYPNQIYKYERGTNVVTPGITCNSEICNDSVIRKTSWIGKIALPYPSDYGYSANLSECDQSLKYYDSCKSSNWLYKNLTLEAPVGGGWLLTPIGGSATRVYSVDSSGIIDVLEQAKTTGGASPTFYLDADLIIESGIGTQSEPYKVK